MTTQADACVYRRVPFYPVRWTIDKLGKQPITYPPHACPVTHGNVVEDGIKNNQRYQTIIIVDLEGVIFLNCFCALHFKTLTCNLRTWWHKMPPQSFRLVTHFMLAVSSCCLLLPPNVGRPVSSLCMVKGFPTVRAGLLSSFMQPATVV